jgi:hypothetical protein
MVSSNKGPKKKGEEKNAMNKNKGQGKEKRKRRTW